MVKHNLGVNIIHFVQDDPQSIRLENIIDMGLGFSSMIRLFDKGSKSLNKFQVGSMRRWTQK